MYILNSFENAPPVVNHQLNRAYMNVKNINEEVPHYLIDHA